MVIILIYMTYVVLPVSANFVPTVKLERNGGGRITMERTMKKILLSESMKKLSLIVKLLKKRARKFIASKNPYTNTIVGTVGFLFCLNSLVGVIADWKVSILMWYFAYKLILGHFSALSRLSNLED